MITQQQLNNFDWSVDSWEQPASRSGGDFSVSARSAQTLRVFLGDVTGHDEQAAETARRVRRIIGVLPARVYDAI